MNKNKIYKFSHRQMTEIASALREGFGDGAEVDWLGWNRITCKIEGIDEPLIIDRREGITWPDGIAPEVVAGIDLDIRAVCAAS